MKRILIKILLLLVGILAVSCSDKNSQDTLAFVGNVEISADEFRKNYEFGWADLKRGKTEQERKLNYLNLMIAEKLLAEYGYEQGYDQSAYVKSNIKRLTKELQIEALINNDIKAKIEVTENDINDAVNKSNTKFKFRYWIETDKGRALEVSYRMKSEGYAKTVSELLDYQKELNLTPDMFETDYLTWLDVDEATLKAVTNLEIGQISDPVNVNGKYFIYQVTDVQRNTFTDKEYKDKAPTMYKILFHKKLSNAIVSYTDSLLTPENITSKGDVVKVFASALYEYYKKGLNKKYSFRSHVDVYRDSSKFVQQFFENKKKIVVSSNEMEITLIELAAGMNYEGLANAESKQEFLRMLQTRIGMTARDFHLQRIASEKGYGNEEKYTKQLNNWRDKWVFEVTAGKLLNNENELSGINRSNAGKLKDMLRFADSLRTQIAVSVDTAKLNSVKVTESEKSRWASVQVFKTGVNRPAVPVAEPYWSLILN